MMIKFILAALLAGVVIVVSGIALSLVLGETSKMLAAKFTFQMSGTERFIYHVGLRLAIGLALTVLVYFVAPTGGGRLLLVVTAAWFLAYVPNFLFLADLAVLSLGKAAIAIFWGWAEFAVAGLLAQRILLA